MSAVQHWTNFFLSLYLSLVSQATVPSFSHQLRTAIFCNFLRFFHCLVACCHVLFCSSLFCSYAISLIQCIIVQILCELFCSFLLVCHVLPWVILPLCNFCNSFLVCCIISCAVSVLLLNWRSWYWSLLNK